MISALWRCGLLVYKCEMKQGGKEDRRRREGEERKGGEERKNRGRREQSRKRSKNFFNPITLAKSFLM